LTRRIREAQKLLRRHPQAAAKRDPALTKVTIASRAGLTRYIFELPELIPVTSNRTTDNLTLVFTAPLSFDLTNVKVMPPPSIRSIETETGQDSASVHFAFRSKADARTFREDNSFIVDIRDSDAE
ncbi:MAG: hypothetical protein K8F62_10735, partial [Pseudorhodoplanes sp.]|nr:hypothetical protein [Pseudorhodoplanes sp.]